MSNNKQTMKLYTEADVLNMLRSFHNLEMNVQLCMLKLTPIELPSDMLCVNCDERKPTHNICMECMIKVGKQNIELPSDEEIENMGKDVIVYNDTKRGWFVEGLKFMRDKIQGGNK